MQTEPTTLHVDTPPAVLTDSQKAINAKAEAERKAAEEKSSALLAADAEFQEDVKAAAEKRRKALEKYPDESMNGTIERAWNAVRGEDPVYAETAGPFREKLTTHAESVQRTGVPSENPSPFETEFGRLWAEQQAKQKKGGMAQQQTVTSRTASEARQAVNVPHFTPSAIDADYKGDVGEKGRLASAKNDKSDADKGAKKK